jgi:hypothetical protein
MRKRLKNQTGIVFDYLTEFLFDLQLNASILDAIISVLKCL